MEWWKTAIIYQVYPRSFMDSNGDGIGDLNGIKSRLNYFEYLNVGAVWLSPFLKSPMRDFGYDISDFRDVDPIFGTLEHFDQLVQDLHARATDQSWSHFQLSENIAEIAELYDTAHPVQKYANPNKYYTEEIKVIIDFVPNHTSDQHEWFQKSCRREPPYSNYYIWHDGQIDVDGKRQPPNNWLSVFGGTAWRWHEGRGQFYYSAFLAEQPDLNYRNPDVVREMNDVVRFWMKRNVDGIRVDALDFLFEVEDVSLDEPRSNLPGISPFQHQYLNHIYTVSLPEIGDIVKGWRRILDEFEQEDGRSRWMVIETYSPPEWRNLYYDYGSTPFNMDLVQELQAPLSGNQIRELVEREYKHLPPNGWPTFVLGNHDRKRVSKRYGARYVDALNMLLLTLRGTPTTYYGEELGMEEIEVSFEQTQDPLGKNFGPEGYRDVSRDPLRNPMQWDSTKNAGFSTSSSPWLPIHPDYVCRNVKAQQESQQQTSLKLYSELARLREYVTFRQGDLLFAVTNENIFSYVRQMSSVGSNADRYLVALNFGQTTSKDDYSGEPLNSSHGQAVECTCNVNARFKNATVDLRNLELEPGAGLVIKLL